MENLPNIFVFDKNENSRAIIKSFLENLNFIEGCELFENYQEGCEAIRNSNNPIAIIDISEKTENINEIIENINLYTSKIIITSISNSTNTIIKALRLGAKEFLPKPILKDDLTKAIKKLSNTITDDDINSSKIISVYSNKGGIGKTTIAINLASELAKATKSKVALVDLNLQLGDIATFLNINPPFDVNYVMRKLVGKKDLINGFEKYKDTSLYVLSDPVYIEQAECITPEMITTLFSALRKEFSFIIVDMSSNIDPITLKILDESDQIFFTSIVNLPAIRNAQRCLNLFNSRNYPNGKVKIIINRYMENDEINIEDIEKTLGEKIYWKIPNNYFTIMDAINKGKTISEINAKSNISNSFSDLATKILDNIIEQTAISYKL